MHKIILFIATLLLGLGASAAWASDDDEVSLFSAGGKAEAYIALDEELTIYLWSGKPVAYLERNDDGYDVYGFNGEHLGWFIKGVIWGHDGNGICATKEAMNTTDFEPFKAFKQFKPFKALKKFAPTAWHGWASRRESACSSPPRKYWSRTAAAR